MNKLNVVSDLIRAWGVQKFMEGVTSALRKLGASERTLANDVDNAVKRYVDRQ